MKQSLLDKLKGMKVTQAKLLVRSKGHEPYLVPENCTAITLVARPNTVVLWQNNGLITTASAGDPVELED